MKLQTYDLGLDTLDHLEGADSLCLFVGEDERPLTGLAGFVDWRLCGRLSRVLQNGYFTGGKSDCLLLPTDGRIAMPRAFVFGLGRTDQLTAEKLGELLEEAAQVLSKAKVENVALEFPPVAKLDEAERAKLVETRFASRFGGRVALVAEKSVQKHLARP